MWGADRGSYQCACHHHGMMATEAQPPQQAHRWLYRSATEKSPESRAAPKLASTLGSDIDPPSRPQGCSTTAPSSDALPLADAAAQHSRAAEGVSSRNLDAMMGALRSMG